jgi:hypothetical protein
VRRRGAEGQEAAALLHQHEQLCGESRECRQPAAEASNDE